MAIYKCKMCGGELNITEDTSVCECEYCGSKQTISTIDDEKIIKLYDRANRLRMANEFDKASGVYESIIAESDTEAEAYWGLILCKYGIEYVDDPASGNKIPTCHRSSFDSIMDDSDFDMVMENADMLARSVYREQAKQIEKIRKGIIEVSGKEEPYDIFICYKETDENGDRTIDSVLAQNIYDALTDKGYRVFFSRISLEDKLGTEYEPYIFAALNSAKIMLAFGTSYDYYNAVWVKNEWSRFLKIMAKDKSKKLIPCYKDIDAYDMPKEFKSLQAQDMGKVGADQDLIRGINKILRPEESLLTNSSIGNASQQDIQDAVIKAMASNISSNIDVLIERGFMSLEDGDFEKAYALFEDVLNQNSKCAEAYMGKLLACYKSRGLEALAVKIYHTFFVKPKKTLLISGFDISKLIDEKFILSDRVSSDTSRNIIIAFNIWWEDNRNCIKFYDETVDYIEKLCQQNNSDDSEYRLASSYYKRYLQYASDDILSKFDIKKTLKDVIQNEIEKEEQEVEELLNTYSSERVMSVIERANERANNLSGRQLYRMEEKYQADLVEWKKIEKQEQEECEKWEIECKEARRDWPIRKQQILHDWEMECKVIEEEYEQKKKLASENNKNVKLDYQHALLQYEEEIEKINMQICSLNNELSSVTLLFKVKQKDEIKNKILLLESKKNNMTKPILENFGSIIAEPKLELPPRPELDSGPILPEKPTKTEKPTRSKIDINFDVDELLISEFEKSNFNIPIEPKKKTIETEVGKKTNGVEIGKKNIIIEARERKEAEKALEELKKAPNCKLGPTELGNRLGMSTLKASRLLHVLMDQKLVVKDADGITYSVKK